MNMVEAYRAITDPTYERRRMTRNRGVLRVSYELLESMLELPRDVRIISMHPNHLTAGLDVVLSSDEQIEGITFPINEAMITPNVDIEILMSRLQHNNTRE